MTGSLPSVLVCAALLIVATTGCQSAPATPIGPQVRLSPSASGVAASPTAPITADNPAPASPTHPPAPEWPSPLVGLPSGEYVAYLDIRQPSMDVLPTPVLLAVAAQGGTPTELASGYWVDTISPDGRTATHQDGAGSPLYLLDLVTGEDHAIPGTDVCDDPSWSPGREWLACGDGDVLVVNATTGIGSLVSSCPDSGAAPTLCDSPAWSPNGRWIAYLRAIGRSGPPLASDGIYVVDVACLTLDPACKGVTIGPIGPWSWAHLAWSPDATRLVAATGEELREYDMATGGSRVIVRDFNVSSRLSWSLQSGRIAFENLGNVHTIDLETGEIRTLVDAVSAEIIGWFVKE